MYAIPNSNPLRRIPNAVRIIAAVICATNLIIDGYIFLRGMQTASKCKGEPLVAVRYDNPQTVYDSEEGWPLVWDYVFSGVSAVVFYEEDLWRPKMRQAILLPFLISLGLISLLALGIWRGWGLSRRRAIAGLVAVALSLSMVTLATVEAAVSPAAVHCSGRPELW